MHIVVHNSLSELDHSQWNALVKDDNPFMRHEFLAGLELCNCVTPQSGWSPMHIAVYADEHRKQLLGAMPCYQKDNSYGEYIFDWAWADAHFRHGKDYYPKLSNAVPFTPATGQRYLCIDDQGAEEILQLMLDKARQIVDEDELSSFHSLFLPQEQCAQMARAGLLERHSSQFHWRNKGYQNFDDFLAQLSSKKRKNIKRERRRVHETGIQYRWLAGDDLSPELADQMYQFYARTIRYYGAQSYLNQEFFRYLVQHFKQHTLFLFAYFEDQVIAGGLYFKSNNTLYGRYWGALNNFHSVHFETCYYQAIEWCINNGFQGFEAGAQGQHKLARGLEAVTTYSAHHIRDPRFKHAIADFLEHEKDQIEGYVQHMDKHSPFKQEI